MKIYTKLPLEIRLFGELLIKDTESKHIAINTPLQMAQLFEQNAKQVNYPFCYMSMKNNYSITANKKYVQTMANSPNFRPAKYIIDKAGRVWTDNTHTSLSIMLRNGITASINSAHFYFVDLREEIVIFQPEYLPVLSNEIYRKIINNSLKLQKKNRQWLASVIIILYNGEFIFV